MSEEKRLTAEMARQLAMSPWNKHDESEYKYLIEVITDTAEFGGFDIEFQGTIRKKISDRLLEDGYAIQVKGEFTAISW